jgi:hypothetical protein
MPFVPTSSNRSEVRGIVAMGNQYTEWRILWWLMQRSLILRHPFGNVLKRVMQMCCPHQASNIFADFPPYIFLFSVLDRQEVSRSVSCVQANPKALQMVTQLVADADEWGSWITSRPGRLIKFDRNREMERYLSTIISGRDKSLLPQRKLCAFFANATMNRFWQWCTFQNSVTLNLGNELSCTDYVNHTQSNAW